MKALPKPQGAAQVIRLTFLIIFSLLSLILIAGILLNIIGDIAAGALSGEPETGWGFLFAIILAVPGIICLAISIILYLFYKKAAKQQLSTAQDTIEQPTAPTGEITAAPQSDNDQFDNQPK